MNWEINSHELYVRTDRGAHAADATTQIRTGDTVWLRANGRSIVAEVLANGRDGVYSAVVISTFPARLHGVGKHDRIEFARQHVFSVMRTGVPGRTQAASAFLTQLLVPQPRQPRAVRAQ